jgi:hypothetical protein
MRLLVPTSIDSTTASRFRSLADHLRIAPDCGIVLETAGRTWGTQKRDVWGDQVSKLRIVFSPFRRSSNEVVRTLLLRFAIYRHCC